MTQRDYLSCMLFLSALSNSSIPNPKMPSIETLRAQCGGIVGEVDIVDCVTESESPWFFGDYGFVLANPKPMPLQPCKGALKFFDPTKYYHETK